MRNLQEKLVACGMLLLTASATLAGRFVPPPAAREALSAAGDRAVEFGDAPAAAVYYSLANASGWAPDPARAKVLQLSARRRDSLWPEQIPFDASWYLTAEGMLLPKYLPA